MIRRRMTGAVCALLPLLLTAGPAFADDAGPPKIDSGDTAWMLASTALVLMMTVPGLALFYGGMVRKKNILATLMQCFVITCIVTLVWCVAGYSLAFTPGNAYVGDLSRFMLHGIADHISKGNDTQAFVLASGVKDVPDMTTTIPETVYMMFQMTFAIITPAAMPMMIDDPGSTKPDAGVMATRPATAPEIAPRTEGLPLAIHSANIQPSAAAAVAICVTAMAIPARPFEATADPALKPNQPTQSSEAPITA